MQSIYALSDSSIVVTFTAATCLYTLALYNLLRATIGRLKIPADPYFGINIIGTLVSLSAVLLTFTLIQSINLSQRIEGQITNEVSLIETLDETLALLHDEKARLARVKLAEYTSSVINDEWNEMILGRESVKTERLYDRLLPTISEIEAHGRSEGEIYEHAVSISYELSKSRHSRLAFAGTKLSWHFWMGITALFTLNVLQFFLLAQRSTFSSLILMLHMSALGVLLGLIVVHDQPFQSESRSLSKPFYKALEEIRSR